MVVAGLTGGIASGKSTVAGYLAALGARIVDADAIAHAVVKKGLPAWQKIRGHFGPQVLLPDGELNRVVLGDIVFGDHERKQVLNDIVHPAVFAEMDHQLKAIELADPGALAVMDVPLLIESGMGGVFSEVILVYVPEKLQLERLMARDGLNRAAAEARIRAQMPIEEKRARASIVIDNSSSKEETRARTEEVFGYLTGRGGVFVRKP